MTDNSAKLLGLHHIQLAMPEGEEEAALKFYGAILGLTQVAKPPELAPRGGLWFRDEALEVHLGIEEPFTPARKAHPAFLVEDQAAAAARLRGAGFDVDERERETFEGYLRFHAFDPHGNRVEVLERRQA